MGVLCNIFGHKLESSNTRGPNLRPTGWTHEYNAAYRWVELGFNCQRCSQLIPIGIMSEEKEKDNGKQT